MYIKLWYIIPMAKITIITIIIQVACQKSGERKNENMKVGKYHMEKNEIEFLVYTIYKNQLQMV